MARKSNSGRKDLSQKTLDKIDELEALQDYSQSLKAQINDMLSGFRSLAGGLDGFNDTLSQVTRLMINLAADGSMMVSNITDIVNATRDLKISGLEKSGNKSKNENIGAAVADTASSAAGVADAASAGAGAVGAAGAAGTPGAPKGASGGGMGIFGAVLGGLGAAASLVSGIVGIFKKRKEEEKRYRKEQEDALRRQLTAEVDLSLATSKRLVTEQAITREKYKQIQVGLEKSSYQKGAIQSDINADLRDSREKLNGDYSKQYKKSVSSYMGALADLNAHKDDLEWLETVGGNPLINQSDDYYKRYQAFYERLLKIAQQEKEWRDQQKELANDTIGSTTQTLADSWVDAFKKGEEATWDFAKNFEDVMRQAIVNGFSDSIIAAQIDPIFNKFRDKIMGYLSGDLELDEVVTPDLQREIESTSEKIKKLSPELKKILESLGLDVENAGSETLSASIRGVSEQTASVVAGQMNAIRTNQVKSMDMFAESLASLSMIEANTRYNRYLESIDKRLGAMSSAGGTSLRAAGLA